MSHGRYTIVRKIADGGMAEIFLATLHGAEGFERVVVLKRILTAFYADPQFRNMLLDEAHIAMSLNHSNIVQVLDLGQADGRYFLVLELVDGWDLAAVLERAKAVRIPWPPELALYVTAEVCRALAYAHGKTRNGKAMGIVHRDISPQNVLLSDQGEVKLTDFGIAKALNRREQTAAGVIKGKLDFMSPEQASGAPLDARSDIFSVGVMLYVMATGRRPFLAPTDLESMLRVQKAEFPAPREVRPDVDPETARITMQAMQLVPSERYRGAEDMLLDVEKVLRTAFRPAGQTELKRWLADLSRKDSVPSLGKASGAPRRQDEGGEIFEGKTVVLEDSDAPSVARGAAAATAAVAEQEAIVARPALAAAVAAASVVRDDPSVPTRVERLPKRRGALRGALMVAIGAAAALAAVRALVPDVADRAVRATRQALVEKLAVDGAAPPEAAAGAAGNAPVAVPPPAAVPATTMVTAAAERSALDAAPGPSSQTPVVDEANEEEIDDENALRQEAIDDGTQTVVGEEDSEPGPAADVPTGGAGWPAGESARSEPGARPKPARAVVSVRIRTSPPGARVRLPDRRTFGPTPIAMRFRVGGTYRLRFLKTGYLTQVKNVRVGAKTPRVVAVRLPKKTKPSGAKPSRKTPSLSSSRAHKG